MWARSTGSWGPLARAGAVLALSVLAGNAHAADLPWSATLYGGPATTKFVSQIVLDGQFDATSGMAGLAIDRRIFRLGGGFPLEGEAQLTQFVGHHCYTVGSIGPGIRYTWFWRRGEPASFAFYTGP